MHNSFGLIAQEIVAPRTDSPQQSALRAATRVASREHRRTRLRRTHRPTP